MKSIWSSAIAGAFLVTASTQAQAGALPERVVKVAEASVADGVYQTLVFGVVDGDHSAIVTFGALDDGKAPNGDTVYEIGSITKTFTATLLAQEVLSKRVTLETPVAKLLPDFTIPSRDGKQITLGEIGTQRSGLPRLPSNLLPSDPANPYADYDSAKLKTFLAGYELTRDPGASYEYSNLGFGLLGYALAQSNHTTYGDRVTRQIFRPLGMSMSGTSFSDAMRAHLARGHDENGKPASNWDLDALAGAGAIRSTANDMLRYLKANMGVGHSPLEAAIKFAQQPRADIGNGTRIGLAWMTTPKGIVWHNGGTGGYRSFIGFTADRRHGVVILTNTAAEVDQLGFAVLDPEAPLSPPRKAIPLPAASLDAYVGTYKLADKFLLKIFRHNDSLFAQATGQGAIPIFASAPDEFFAKVGGISITFERDPKGAVNGLVLHQNGDRAAPKMSAAELPPEPKETVLDAATLRGYVGKYQFSFGAMLDVTLSGDQLSAQLTGQPSVAIYPSARDEFFYKVVDAQLSYERDAAGKVMAVVLHQNGRDMRAPRITEH
jgi:D-alanyl-D-alanine-carboxypeptidase/D-alanyl-D-alanine-endopeptidase